MKPMSTCLWFDSQAEEAAKFYVSVFNGKMGKISRYGADVPFPEGSVSVVEFEINGRNFWCLNGGPNFKFTEAISLVINCENQEEVDTYWSKLTQNGGQEVACGWLKDKYGLAWQIVPIILMEMMTDPDPKKTGRVMKAFMKMKKFDIETLKKAYEG